MLSQNVMILLFKFGMALYFSLYIYIIMLPIVAVLQYYSYHQNPLSQEHSFSLSDHKSIDSISGLFILVLFSYIPRMSESIW